MSDTPSIIEYSIDHGATWHHGRTIAAWVRADPDALAVQRGATREFARDTYGNVDHVVTRIMREDDPRCVVNQPAKHQGYTDRAGIDARANSALLTVEAIITDYSIPSAVRLVLVAERMAREPILTDSAPAAYTVRAEASRYRKP